MYETSIDLVLRIRCHVVFEVSDLLITAQQRKMNEDYSVLRLFYALTAAVNGHHPCLNCGVRRMPNGGVCSRCLGLPYCRNCKRHLSSNCFDDPNVCQVRFMPSSRLQHHWHNSQTQLSHADYCLFVSGMHPQTKKTSLHARHPQHRQRSAVAYK